jgi:hypothetical protein
MNQDHIEGAFKFGRTRELRIKSNSIRFLSSLEDSRFPWRLLYSTLACLYIKEPHCNAKDTHRHPIQIRKSKSHTSPFLSLKTEGSPSSSFEEEDVHHHHQLLHLFWSSSFKSVTMNTFILFSDSIVYDINLLVFIFLSWFFRLLVRLKAC